MFFSRSSPLYLVSTVILGFFALSISWLQAQAPTGTVTSSLTNLVEVGHALTMNVTVNSTTPAQLRWLRDGKLVTGATSAALAIPAISFAEAGSYHLEARNASGTWKSPVIRVGVHEVEPWETRKTITYQKGQKLNLEAKVAGPVTVVWDWNPYLGGVREGASIPMPPLPNGTHLLYASVSMNEPYVVAAVAYYDLEVKGFPTPPLVPSAITLKTGEPVGPWQLNAIFSKTEADRYVATGLPPGITLTSDGIMSGSPSAKGFYLATFYATDGMGRSRNVTTSFCVESTKWDVARRYTGIAEPDTYLGGESGAVVTVQVSAAGAYSAQSRGRSGVRRWTGQFERGTGLFDQLYTEDFHTFPREGSVPSREVLLELDADAAQIEIDDYRSSIYLFADYQPIVEASHDIQGRHTLKMTAPDILGVGIGSAMVGKNHSVTLVGTLPDGTGVTAGGPLTQSFGVPMLLMSEDRRDTVTCVLQMDVGGQSETQAAWKKRPASSSKIHPDGFQKELSIELQRYRPPTAGKMIAPRLAATEGLGQFTAVLPEHQPGAGQWHLEGTLFRMSRQHQPVIIPRNFSEVKCDVYAPTGFFTGSFVVPPSTGVPYASKKIHFRGMLNSESGLGLGQFSVPGEVEDPDNPQKKLPRIFSGRVELLPIQK